jgi:hypothetical protein
MVGRADAVRAAIERRVSALPDAAQRVVAAASVWGNARNPVAFSAVADLPLDAALDGTDLAIGAVCSMPGAWCCTACRVRR